MCKSEKNILEYYSKALVSFDTVQSIKKKEKSKKKEKMCDLKALADLARISKGPVSAYLCAPSVFSAHLYVSHSPLSALSAS